jgi:4-amino-4-deoxy-L-arabinose transferase-like glycosyltransferase
MTIKASQIGRRFAFTLGLALVFPAGLALRIWGILWSLPASGGYSRHPDEVFQVASASLIDFRSLQLNPHFYNYGAMYMYLVSLATGIASGLGLANSGDVAARYLVARMVTVLLGAATPYLVYLAASRLYDRRLAIAAAAFAAIMPIAVVHSHFATVDIPAAFWVAACLAASAAISTSGAARQYVLAGLFAGFAAATKYGTVVVVLAPIVAHFAGRRDSSAQRPTAVALMLVIGWAIVGFVIGNPGCALWPSEFLKGFLFEYQHARVGHGFVFAQTGSGWAFHLVSSLRYGLGLPLLVLALAGLIPMALDRSRRGWPLVVFAVAYYLLIGFAKVRFARYVIPLMPVLAIAASFAVFWVYDQLSRMRFPTCWVGYGAWSLVCAGIVYYTFAYTMAIDRLFTAPDPRVSAAAWLDGHAPKGSAIALPTVPWFYSPTLSPKFTNPLPSERAAAASHLRKYRLIVNPAKPWDAEPLKSLRPGYVIVTDYEDVDAVRAKDPDALKYLRTLRDNYAPVIVERNRLKWDGLDFGPTRDLPHDLKYASPTITIYRRRG